MRSHCAHGQAQPLNDTGVTICYAPNAPCDPVQHKRQDAIVGRDAAARIVGSGLTTNTGKGYTFTKIARNGVVLSDSAVLGDNPGDWACTRDNVTGLTWEVKRDSPTASRYFRATYSWYDDNALTNGGNPGEENAGSCPIAGRCDSKKYLEDIRATGICGKSNWRLPTVREIFTLLDLGASRANTLDVFFPNLATTPNAHPYYPNFFMTSRTRSDLYAQFIGVRIDGAIVFHAKVNGAYNTILSVAP